MFFYINENNYCICTTDMCIESDNTFDITINELANSPRILDKLNLLYLEGGFGKSLSYNEIAESFIFYISSFNTKKQEIYTEYLSKNPVIRLLVTNEELLKYIKYEFNRL